MKQELLQQASDILKLDMSKIGKRNSRINEDTAENNAQRLRAIDGICGSCESFKIEFSYIDGKKRVVLRCVKGFSPLELYRRTELGKEANCNGFTETSLNKNL